MAMRTASAERMRQGGRVLAALSDEWTDRQLMIPSADVRVVRTAGAGDAATGGLLYGLVAARSPERAIRLATVAAALHCTGLDRLPSPASDPIFDELDLKSAPVTAWKADHAGVLHGPADPTILRSSEVAAGPAATPRHQHSANTPQGS